MTIVSANIEDSLAYELETFCKASGLTMSAVIKGLLAEKLHNEPSIVTIQRDISEKFIETDRKLQTIGAILTAMMEQELILETFLQILTVHNLEEKYRGRTMPEDFKIFHTGSARENEDKPRDHEKAGESLERF